MDPVSLVTVHARHWWGASLLSGDSKATWPREGQILRLDLTAPVVKWPNDRTCTDMQQKEGQLPTEHLPNLGPALL